MPRLPIFNPLRPDEQAIAEHHLEEYAAGLDRVGPEFDSDEDDAQQEVAVRAAGATAYYQIGGEC